jgi:hypothetical protein
MSNRQHIGMHPLERWLLYVLAVLAFVAGSVKLATAGEIAARFRIPVAH